MLRRRTSVSVVKEMLVVWYVRCIILTTLFDENLHSTQIGISASEIGKAPLQCPVAQDCSFPVLSTVPVRQNLVIS